MLPWKVNYFRSLSIWLRLDLVLTVRNARGQTPLHLAGILSVVRCLIEQKGDIEIKDHIGETALHITAQLDRIEIMRINIENDRWPRYKHQLQTEEKCAQAEI